MRSNILSKLDVIDRDSVIHHLLRTASTTYLVLCTGDRVKPGYARVPAVNFPNPANRPGKNRHNPHPKANLL